MLLESLLDNLAARQKDPCASVRRLVLRGLANLASGSPDKVSCPPAPGVDCDPGDPGRCGGCVWRLPGAPTGGVWRFCEPCDRPQGLVTWGHS